MVLIKKFGKCLLRRTFTTRIKELGEQLSKDYAEKNY